MKKWAIITGASAGIGEATAKELAQLGWNLILLGRHEDRLKQVEKSLKALSPDQAFRSVVVDVQKKRDVDRFVENYKETLPHVELLVNNAGLARGSEKFQEAQTEDWDQMIDTNIKGLLYLTRGVLPFMIAKNSGHIVNMGSVAGRWVYEGGAVYCATKFAVRALSEGLRMDLHGKNIRVSNVEPGMVQTDFSLVRFDGNRPKADAVYAGMKPLTAKDIAETIVWIVNRPQHINVQELVIYPTDQSSIRMVHRT